MRGVKSGELVEGRSRDEEDEDEKDSITVGTETEWVIVEGGWDECW